MTIEVLTKYIADHFDGKLTPLESGRFNLMCEVKPADLLAVARRLRDDEELAFDFFCNVGGVDTVENFEAVYSIASTTKHLRLDFKVVLPRENPSVDSLKEIWPGIDWYEREMWELFGIDIKNHGDLKQLLLPDDWDQGYPMRKDWDAPDFIRMPEL